MIGERIAHYSISEKLGEGGMGEVYRASDSKLGRDVALKVLPAAFANDGERMARFAREAQVLASLNHPNIAAIYGIEEGDERGALIMELVEGETLGERIAKGAVPVGEALQIALQIAFALEEAHDKGIVHRDLKPANVKITPAGVVKVLDFGLAKAVEGEASEQNLANSPTLTAKTQLGVLMGTAAYMSPEQARGEPADRRADVWAFGIVLMEMLTGEMVYQGKTVSDTLAGVLARKPTWDRLPKDTPRALRALLERCLEKEAKQRLQAIGEARIAIERYLEEGEEEEKAEAEPTVVAESIPRWKKTLPWGVVAVLALAASALGWQIFRVATTAEPVVRFQIRPPEGVAFHLNPLNAGPAVLSPDGRSIAYSATDKDGQTRLFVRRLDRLEAVALPGTEDAQYPFWSPDSRWLGFFTQRDSSLKKIDSTGGPPLTLCTAADGKGGSWSQQGVILFTPNSGKSIFSVSSAGGETSQVTDVDTDAGFNSHRHPRFLPDGEHFLYLARSTVGDAESEIRLRSLQDGAEKFLVHSGVAPAFASRNLLYLRENTLMAHPFDVGTREFTGEAAPVGERIVNNTAAAFGVFSASRDGTLVYQTGDALTSNQLLWFDRTGLELGELGESSLYETIALSPTGTHAVVGVEEAGGLQDLWMFEIDRNLMTRFTFDPGREQNAIWAPEGESVFFVSVRGDRFGLYRKSLGGVSDEELLVEADSYQYPTGVSPDGEILAFAWQVDGTGFDIWMLPLDGEGEAYPFRQTEFNEGEGVFSPDGRWLAYDSDESGTWETYVTAFPGPGRRWQVSSEGGTFPIWNHDGSELFFQQDDGTVVAVAVDGSGDTFLVREATALFDANPPSNYYQYAVAPDGQSFLAVINAGGGDIEPLTVVMNWTAELETR